MYTSFITGNKYVKNLWELLRDLKVDDKYKNKLYQFSTNESREALENPFVVDKTLAPHLKSVIYSSSPIYFKYRSIVYHYNTATFDDPEIFKKMKSHNYEPKKADYKKIVYDEICNNVWFFFREYAMIVDDLTDLIRYKYTFLNDTSKTYWDDIIQKESMLSYDELTLDQFLFLIAYEYGFKKIILKNTPSNNHFIERFYFYLRKIGKMNIQCYFNTYGEKEYFYKNVEKYALFNNSILYDNIVDTDRNRQHKQKDVDEKNDYNIFCDNDCLVTFPYMDITGCALVDLPYDSLNIKIFDTKYVDSLKLLYHGNYYKGASVIMDKINRLYIKNNYYVCSEINQINEYLNTIEHGDRNRTLVINITSSYVLQQLMYK